MKKYLVHYHIYKNAGSTIDNAIKRSFGKESLIELDKVARYKNSEHFDAQLIESIIQSGTDAVAFSSHRMTPTVHRSKSYSFIPLVCVRHPLLRAGSVYRYERKRNDEKPGKEFAKTLDFVDWLEWSIDQTEYIESRNYQTTLLSIPDVNEGEEPVSAPNIALAKSRLDEIPVVGVVEYFDETCRLLEALIGDEFKQFSIGNSHDNRTKEIESWKVELKNIQSQLPVSLLKRFEEKNSMDYELFWYAVKNLRDLKIPELLSA